MRLHELVILFCVSKFMRVFDEFCVADTIDCVCMEGGGGNGIAGIVNSRLFDGAMNEG